MKILHICQRDDPDTGGSLRVAEALVREQRLAGHDAWLLFLYGAQAHVYEAFAPHAVCLGLDSSREAIQGILKLQQAVRRICPDIIHSHDGILWPRLAFLLSRIPVVMHTHLPVADKQTPKDAVGRKLVRLTTRSLIGISLHTIDTWVAGGYPPSKIHFVPNGVDFNRFTMLDSATKQALRRELGLPVEKKILLWVGRIHCEMKGSDRVERIAGALPEDMVLVVVGNGPDLPGMQERCRKQVDAGKMVLVGSAMSPERYYRAADCFLFTSYHEPFGLVILEAVAAGLPIFAFPVTRGGGAVALLDEFSATMFDDGMDDGRVREMLAGFASGRVDAAAARKRAEERYAWSSVSREVVEVYDLVARKVS